MMSHHWHHLAHERNFIFKCKHIHSMIPEDQKNISTKQNNYAVCSFVLNNLGIFFYKKTVFHNNTILKLLDIELVILNKCSCYMIIQKRRNSTPGSLIRFITFSTCVCFETKVKLNWWKRKPPGSTACMGKQHPRFIETVHQW